MRINIIKQSTRGFLLLCSFLLLIISCSLNGNVKTNASIYYKVPESARAVDLGLSVKWANMNVGAMFETDYGAYFAWGEVTGNLISPFSFYRQETNGWYTYSASTYKWGCRQNDEFNVYKYNTNPLYGIIDNKTILNVEDDAAIINWGGDWRMPTLAEMEELVYNCFWVWTSNYKGTGINGFIVYKAKSTYDKGLQVDQNSIPPRCYSMSDNHIFLPAAGCFENNCYYGVSTYGGYWSSSVCAEYDASCDDAWAIDFKSDYISANYEGCYRSSGQSVRAVCE